MARQLKVVAGTDKDKGRSFELPERGSLHLGRAPETDTLLTDVRVSGSHCRVYAEGPRVTITDNGSTNGTFVNDRPLAPDELRDLVPGDVIRLGENTQLELASDDIAVMKTVGGNADMVARELAAYAAKLPPAPPSRPAARPPSSIASAPRAPSRQVSARAHPAEPTVAVTCSCGQQLMAREKYAGSQVRCPTCRNLLQLPGRPALAQPAGDKRLEEARASSPRARWLGRVATIAAGILLVLAAGVFLASLLTSKTKSVEPATMVKGR